MQVLMSLAHSSPLVADNDNTSQRLLKPWLYGHDDAEISREHNLTAETFFEQYYLSNRPVILKGMASPWPACQRWSPEDFKARFGDTDVEIQTGRESSPQYQRDFESCCRTIRLADYVDQIRQNAESNDVYLAARNRVFQFKPMEQLFNDLVPLPEFLNRETLANNIFMWLGPAGTVTQLHHDWQNVFFVQVYGQKRFRLVSPRQSHLVYNTQSRFADVDCENPDYQNFPLFQEATLFEFTLNAGDCLFIPVGWWHHVRALEVSISLSLTNFSWQNSYDWQVPVYD
jgi:ribosomal protein L16 Arg81 hydroxylase